MKKVFLIFALLIIPVQVFGASSLAVSLSGRILLEVEENGEAWYIHPNDLKRYFLGRPSDAFNLMREKGVGITNSDLEKIPMNIDSLRGYDTDKDGLPDSLEDAIGSDKNKSDTDGDGYNDKTEIANGYSPNENRRLKIDNNFTKNNYGKIFLQIEQNGEAWYIDPISGKRFFLSRPQDAFNVMRSLGLGITNENILKIEVSENDQVNEALVYSENKEDEISLLEKNVHELINKEREKQNLGILVWDDKVATVARRHSGNLVSENSNLTDSKKLCNYPIIHHEGMVFGIDNMDRLQNSGITDFRGAGENIVLMPNAYYTLTADFFEECKYDVSELRVDFDNAIKGAESEAEKIKVIEDEIKKREAMMASEKTYKIFKTEELSEDSVAESAVVGWMNSPGHKANILTADFNETGIGIALFEGYAIMTQIFIMK